MWWRPLVGFLWCVSCLERRKRSGVRIRDQEGSYQGFTLDSKSHRQRENNWWLMQDIATPLLHVKDTLYVTVMGEAWRDRKNQQQLKDWCCVYLLVHARKTEKDVHYSSQQIEAARTKTLFLLIKSRHYIITMFRRTQPNGCHASSCITVWK